MDGRRDNQPSRTCCASSAPQVLGVLVRRYGSFDECEDAVQEALLAASGSGRPTAFQTIRAHGWSPWPPAGSPTRSRSDSARRRREESVAALAPADDLSRTGAGRDPTSRRARRHADVADDVLPPVLCHRASQAALTLRAVGGLTTAEIARAYFVPEATMAQRISRAKQRIKSAGQSVRTAAPSRS